MAELTFYLDGQYIRTDARVLDVFTPGQQKMHGVFESMRAINGKIEFIDAHLSRLFKGLRALKVRHRLTPAGLKRIAVRLVSKNASITTARVRLMVFQDNKTVHVAGMVLPYKPFPLTKYRRGLRVKLVKTSRPAHARQAYIKSLDYALFTDAHRKAVAEGYDDALLLNAKGHVFEAAHANVFLVKGDTLITPPLSSGCLNGITRGRVIAVARQLDIPVVEKAVTPAMLKAADHVFLVNSMIGMIKISAIS